MKKTIAILCLTLLTFLASATSIIFNGNDLSEYNGENVTFAQTLYVCGHYNHYLYLSYERLRQPEEVAAYGTAAYDSAVVKCSQAIITAYCPDINADTIRLGATLTNLEAKVTGARNIRINGNILANNNIRPTSRPNVGDARLILCAANLEYYCPSWENTYGAESDEEFAIQHLKTIKALTNIDADIYAVTEIQQGRIALDSLVNGLNANTTPGRYSFVSDDDTETNTYTKVGFIYRTDKVTPVLVLGHPYGPASADYQMRAGYHKREYVQCFEENATGERFILCMNHFKSKSGGDTTNNYYNANRVENAEHLSYFLQTELNNRYYNDEDILIVGDLNCGTMEEPVLYLESEGYENQLTRFAPNEYSYVFDDEVEYLDHALASTSMAAQITGAQPYHLNADETYKHYYTYGDTTMYRYSDHDPIIIGISLSFTLVDTCYNYDYQEDFSQSLGSFNTQNVAGAGYWYTYDSYECACANGYYSGANEDWLISPTFDLSNRDNAVVKFDHTMGYGTPSNWGSHCKLMASSNYQGDVTTAQWQEISMDLPAASWQWTHDSIMLPSNLQHQSNVVVAFKYSVASGDIPSWEIKNFALSANCHIDSTGIEIHGENLNNLHTYSINSTIYCNTSEPTDITIFDISGRMIAHWRNTTEATKKVSAGMYIIRAGQEVKKIVVR